MITEIILLIIFIALFLVGFYIIYRQVALVKKGEFKLKDRIQCITYGIIFGLSAMIVVVMGFIFALNTPEFWKNSPTPPPDLNALVLLIPFSICLFYIIIYPLIDFSFIALSEQSDEGLTIFHKILSEKLINKYDNKILSVAIALTLYFGIFILPPFLLSLILPTAMIWISWSIGYPLMILTYFGAKGYIAGLFNAYIHIPDMKRSFFIGFEDPERSFKEFIDDPGPRILIGMMLFVFVWAWISMFQTMSFFFTGSLAISTYSYSGMVFVTLLFGIIGYFTRFWGRKIKYRAIDMYFAAYLIAAVGINVLVNFLIVNASKLSGTFNVWNFTSDITSNYLMFAWGAVIEEIFLIIFTSYYFLHQKNDFNKNLKISKITECGQTFDPIPLFNFIKYEDQEIRMHAEKTLTMMFERAPIKSDVNLNTMKFKNSLMDGICDPNPNARRVSLKVLNQLESDAHEIVLPWIINSLREPNYDKTIPIIRSLLTAKFELIKEIPEDLITNLTRDPEWRLKLYALKVISRLVKEDQFLVSKLNINQLMEDPNSEIQVELLNLVSQSSELIPIDMIIGKLDHSNKEIRAAAIKNLKNLKTETIDSSLIGKIIPLMKDPSSEVRTSIFEAFSKIGHFKKYDIPVLPLLEGLTDENKRLRSASVSALEKYYRENKRAFDVDEILNHIKTSESEVLIDTVDLLGKLWKYDEEKILDFFLHHIKSENEILKQKISDLLITFAEEDPKLIFNKLIPIEDVSRFITRGIITRTLIDVTNKRPKKLIPRLIKFLDSENKVIKINAIKTLEGIVDKYSDLIELESLIEIFQNETNAEIKKEISKVIAKIAQNNPESLKPILHQLLKILNKQESSVKIQISKSLLKIAQESSEMIDTDLILSFLEDKDSFIRETGVKILGFLGTSKDTDKIAKTLIEQGLDDKEWIVREAAVSSLGKIIESVENKDPIIKKLVSLFDDEEGWVRRASMKILSQMKELKPSDIPFKQFKKNLNNKDSKVREATAELMRVYGIERIEKVFDDILMLLEDPSEEVRKTMINTMVNIVEKIGLERILSDLLKNLSDEGSLELQRSIAQIFQKTAKYEDEEIKKRIISLLKIRCEMSQDPTICGVLHQLKES
ncbi:MAG: HEAT repeat protein [Promethearchaeota archaeon]|nr:MAG: HEAT repeat protein [Candidatus Lokiarchaeota archaeon]